VGAGHAAVGRVVHHQRAAALRRGLLRDKGRAARSNVGRRLLRVPARLRAGARQSVAGGGCRRHPPCPVPCHPPPHPGPVLAGPPSDPLRVMSAAIAPTNISGPLAADTLRGETGMVERKRTRLLPFDPWHLLLAPLAVVMLLPMVWMLVTSLETPA